MNMQNQRRTTSAERAELHRLLSEGRLTSYRALVSDAVDADFDELDVYVFNMAVASGLLGPLHILEVVTRNAIHSELVQLAGAPAWWDAPSIALVKRQADEIVAARKRCSVAGKAEPTSSPSDDIVAALDFGFWCGLLGRGKPAIGADYERDLWQPAVRHAFPNYRGTRGDLARHLNAMRMLRNRIGHHEPIHSRDSIRDFELLLRLVNHVSQEVSSWLDDRSRLRQIVSSPPGSASPDCRF